MVTDEQMIAAVRAYSCVDGKCRPDAMRVAIKAALSVSDAEPVAFLRPCRITFLSGEERDSLTLAVKDDARAFPVYAAPPHRVVTIPANVDEAEAMEKLGFAWLRDNAPERLTSGSLNHASFARVKVLEWTEPTKPNEECSYDHIRAEGTWTYQIEWKSWKEEFAVFVVYRDGAYVGAYDSLEAAKAAAQADYEARIRAALVSHADTSPGYHSKMTWIEEGIERAARYIEKQRDKYVQEFGMYDPSTGVTEFSNGGEEHLSTLEELIDGIRALAAAPKEAGRG